jgi:hypothetical protein
LVKPFKIWISIRQDRQKPDKIFNPNVDHWFTDGLGLMTALGQVFMKPYIIIGKANPWAAFAQCFLPK